MDASNRYQIFTTLASHGIRCYLSNNSRAMIQYSIHIWTHVELYEKLWSTYKSSQTYYVCDVSHKQTSTMVSATKYSLFQFTNIEKVRLIKWEQRGEPSWYLYHVKISTSIILNNIRRSLALGFYFIVLFWFIHNLKEENRKRRSIVTFHFSSHYSRETIINLLFKLWCYRCRLDLCSTFS